MLTAVYSNCFAVEAEHAPLLVTAEEAVAATAQGEVRLVDSGDDPAAAHAATLEAWDRSFDWFAQDGDPTMVAGLSVGDLAAHEIAHTVFLPAARGVLEARAAGIAPDHVRIVTATGGPGHYYRYEVVAATAFAAELGVTQPGWGAGTDPRNAALFAKYDRTRDPVWIVPSQRGLDRAQRVAHAVLNAPRRRRSAPSLYVLEYNPTRALATELTARRDRDFRLVRSGAALRDRLRVAAAGDLLGTPVAITDPTELDVRVRRDELRLAGTDVWPVVEPWVHEVLWRYAGFAATAAPRIRRDLERADVQAVIVPFDGPPQARAVVRVAQSLGIRTFVINDGYKADEAQREGFAADVALAWSEGVVESYFARRGARTVVTGNPRATRPKPFRRPPADGGRLRLLIGGFAFSPVDLNCRRSDPARFTREVLAGIDQSGLDVTTRMKLHPADDPAHHEPATHGHAVEVIASGDVGVLFDQADLFVTMYSTSLLEAANAGVPILYYAVNDQVFFRPFEGDPWLAERTARSPEQLAALLKDRELWSQPPPDGWLERYLGPRDGGATDRILQAVRASSALS